MKRLVLMVEGEGDKKAAKSLAARSLEQFCPDWSSYFFIDDDLMRIGDVCALLAPKEEIKLTDYAGLSGGLICLKYRDFYQKRPPKAVNIPDFGQQRRLFPSNIVPYAAL
jgi:hypothetical protein